jgi:HAD superfamily hydrolase (TIGR01662 family)
VAASFDVVVPTCGRASLETLLGALASMAADLSGSVVVVDDRHSPVGPLSPEAPPAELAGRLRVFPGRATGPAAARNVGWRACTSDWVAFLDDDVIPEPDWARALAGELATAAPRVGAVQGQISVPLSGGRRPTDWERNVAGLEDAQWATADMAYRRAALAAVGGFDERFPRAYREDADLGLRVAGAGWTIERGRRRVVHPVRPAPSSVSLRLQAGNRDDVLMRALHGRLWRHRAGAPPGRRRRHVATTLAAAGAVAALATGHRRAAAGATAAWVAGTAELAYARIKPGPRTRREVQTMLWTSALMPAVATYYSAAGLLNVTCRLSTADGRLGVAGPAPAAVLFDRDGTLIHDVPYNGDPARVQPMPGAREALDRLRREGVPVAVVSNQSGVGRGLITRAQMQAVNLRVEQMLGPIATWVVCEHAPGEGCDCRKPAPGLVLAAAERLGVAPARCAVVGDIGSDVEAALAAGARAVLVPTALTRPEEVAAAPEVATRIDEAVEMLVGARP